MISMVKFGITLPLQKYSFELASNIAQYCEELGLFAMFVNDHYMRGRNNIPDAYLTLAAIAARTKRIRIGTAVTPIPFRPVPILAKMVATLDNISKGRFIFGVGAGWIQSEFEGYGVEFPPPGERVSKTIEGLTLMKKMWTEDEVTFKGRYYHVKGNILLPKPVQKPHPPILIGSWSPRMCRAIARLGDGWLHPRGRGHRIEEYRKIMEQIMNRAVRSGRTRDEFTFAHTTRYVLTESKQEDLKKLSIESIDREFVIGSAEECVEELQKYVDSDTDMILFSLAPDIINHAQEQISLFRDKVMSQLDV